MEYTYLHKEASGFYFTQDYELSSEEYPIGTTFDDYKEGKYILLSESQLQFKEEHPEADVEEVINMQIREPEPPTPEEEFETAKRQKIIDMYDYFNSQLKFTVDGKNAYVQDRLYYKDLCSRKDTVILNEVELPSNEAILALDAMSNYFESSSVVLHSKREEIEACGTKQEIEEVDITSGYPESISTTSLELSSEYEVKTASSEAGQAVMLMRSQINTMALAAHMALAVRSIYPEFGEFGAEYGTSVDVGFRCRVTEEGKDPILYEAIQAHTLQENWKPSIYTSSIWEPVVDSSDPSAPKGTSDDPIPFMQGMKIWSGLYYTEDSVKYSCFRDSLIGINNTLSSLVDIYVTVAQ